MIKKIDGKLQIKNDIIETYGLDDEDLLFNIFDLKTVRNKDVQKKIEEYKQLYCKWNLSNEEKIRLEMIKRELKEMNISDSELQGIDSNANTGKLKLLFEKIGGTNA